MDMCASQRTVEKAALETEEKVVVKEQGTPPS